MSNIKFKYDNYDKKRFMDNLKFMADLKRRDAQTLVKQAEAMDDLIQEIDKNIEDIAND